MSRLLVVNPQTIQTNRDLYVFVRDLAARHEEARPLEEYLRALWALARPSRHEPLSIGEAATWLDGAFTASAAPFDDRWRGFTEDTEEEPESYDDWERLLFFQIADLRRMREAGQFENEYRYFGIESPSGSSWYNFDVGTYLECGVRGSVGGYKEDEVVILVPPKEGESADSPVVPIRSYGWGAFAMLLWCGQNYE